FGISKRRRHTIFKCDWSSDVCSSDLEATTGGIIVGEKGVLGVEHRLNHQHALLADDDPARSGFRYSRRIVRIRSTRYERIDALEIGRASCRERRTSGVWTHYDQIIRK